MNKIAEFLNFSVQGPWADMADGTNKSNKIWGNEYLIMDANSFEGGIGEADYDFMIDSFMVLWNAKTYRSSLFA